MYKTLWTPYFHAYETVQDFVDASNLDPDCANVRCRPSPSGSLVRKEIWLGMLDGNKVQCGSPVTRIHIQGTGHMDNRCTLNLVRQNQSNNLRYDCHMFNMPI